MALRVEGVAADHEYLCGAGEVDAGGRGEPNAATYLPTLGGVEFAVIVGANNRSWQGHGDLSQQARLIALHRERVGTTALAGQVCGGGVLGVCRTPDITTRFSSIRPAARALG